MTVEQNVLQHHSQKYQQVLLNQLRDATGTTDTQRLQHALQACNGDLTKAVALLVANNGRVLPQNESAYFLTAQMDAGSHAESSDDKDELQKALALSLSESSEAFRETGVSEEEQAISRVLEASLEANKQSQSTPWSELPNPHDRKRQDSCPVGLKNVGNTCWFSAVIQSLFHLLEFQRLVLLYAPPERSGDLPRNQQESPSVLFVRELRRLFALMLASKRKYVDPSRALEILNTAFKSSGAQQQQDVSEFTHRLLDWLEDAFQVQEEREGEKLKNPLVELFYGQFLALGVLEGKRFENTEMFGQYPLQVNGFKDLHECLEAATIEGEIETLHSGNSGKSGQERWFTELPSVLTFELSRFQFNQAMGRPEKIHSKLEFPSVLYMDRYMHRNREATQLKRAEMRRLREHLTFLQQQLERYLSYGSGPKRLPLAHVLQYAMEFASTKSGLPPSEEEDPRTAAPSGGTNAPLPQPTPSAPPQDAPAPTHPAPRHITPEEMQVLEDCLRRWRTEVETDIQELQGRVASTHGSMERVISDAAMMQVPYRLHAVLVHEGQACTGHYWAYIYSAQHRCWMRYNDIAVTAASWEELAQESYGGHRNASAYCLMYVSTAAPCRPQEEVDEETGQAWNVLDRLPPDLRAYVTEDNQLFEKELEEWDATHSQQANQGTPQPGSTEPSPAQSTVPQEAPDSVDASPTAGALDAWREDVERALSQAAGEDPERTPEALLSAAIKAEYARLVKLAQKNHAPENDYRLRHPVVYFLQNQAPKKVLERTVFQQFAGCSHGTDDRLKAAAMLAVEKVNLMKADEAETDEYEMWHQDYEKFITGTIFLLTGVELFQKKSYTDALVYLVFSSQWNKELLSKGPYGGQSQEVLAYYRRVCLLRLNERAATLFGTGDEAAVSSGMAILTQLVVPCLPLLLADHTQEDDLVTVEAVRNRWCSYLDQEMEPTLLEKLTDVLPRLLDCSGEVCSFEDPPKVPPWSSWDLCDRFRRLIASLRRTSASET
ncbi:ubiquitin carboxyl-terminal hydrolase 25-like isoform X1 [Anguilla rostrata]|uniref:ubiquitin carboxyl-terminal hydrolase 25-like isoform X1 n=2 Tax=Anguilla rostrata TaxID=7938 RepID=UPI0030CC4313